MRENYGFIRADTEELQQCVDHQSDSNQNDVAD